MAFTIPDSDEAIGQHQARWMQSYVDALVAGIGNAGVLLGCVPSVTCSNIRVSVPAGTVRVNGTRGRCPAAR